jgi:hypothetical protein
MLLSLVVTSILVTIGIWVGVCTKVTLNSQNPVRGALVVQVFDRTLLCVRSVVLFVATLLQTQMAGLGRRIRC